MLKRLIIKVLGLHGKSHQEKDAELTKVLDLAGE